MTKQPTKKQIEAALRAWFKLEPREPLDFTSNQERKAMYRDMEATLIAAADAEIGYRREPCLSIGFSGCEKNGHIPGGPIWMLHWLPKGYGPTVEDRLLGVFFDTEGRWSGCGLRMPEDCDEEKPHPLPRLLQVVTKAIEDHLRQHPEDAAGHLEISR